MKVVRKKKPSSSGLTIRIPDDLRERLQKVADKNSVKLNRLVVRILEQAISDPKFVVEVESSD